MLPAGFAPFGIRNLDGTIFVTYAKQDADSFGNGATAGPTGTLFFAVGPNDEENGLLGSVSAG
jgi:hypothetical protein